MERTSLISPTVPLNRPTGSQRAMILRREVLAVCLWCQYQTQDMRHGISDVHHRRPWHAAQQHSSYRIHLKTDNKAERLP
jgi:hypothetical protein